MYNPQQMPMFGVAGGAATPMMNPQVMPFMNPAGMPGMMPGMNPFFNPMQKLPLTEEQKRYLRYIGYLEGKKRAQEELKKRQAQTPKVNIPANNSPQQRSNANEVITIIFRKGGNITKIKMKADKMVAELIDEYFHKTNTKNGKFNFNGNIFTPTTPFTLTEAGLTNNSEIFVS